MRGDRPSVRKAHRRRLADPRTTDPDGDPGRSAVTAGAVHAIDVGAPSAEHQPGVTSFSPTIPATIKATQASRAALEGSPKSAMPRITVPTAPMPVQTA